MAQASSIQREPSMEEILASIRRIIEDNETVQKEAAPESSSSSENEASTEVATFRAELRPTTDFPSDSSASQDMASDDHGKSGLAASAWQNRQSNAKSEPTRTNVDEDPLVGPSDSAGPSRTTFEVLKSIEADAKSVVAEHEQSFEPISAPERRFDSAQNLRPAILSETTGRQVASSFQELNEVLEANRRQNLGQMAEEMLRPMLQEWLDNNLPQLVERLVREEIERIARGA